MATLERLLMPDLDDYRAGAKRLYESEDIDLDSRPPVTEAVTGNYAWVGAWVRVPAEEAHS